MKLLTDQKMRTIDAITANSESALFPAANLLQYDPDLIFMPESFASAVSLVLDLAVASAIPFIWLNNANFLNVTIQANASDTWTSPAVSKDVVLADDKAGIYKGFFALSEAEYRYVRLVIPVQTLLFGDSLPFLGNVIIGEAQELLASTWEPSLLERVDSFESDGGGYTENRPGKSRHVFPMSMSGVTCVEVDSAPLKHWNFAILFTDLVTVADSYLVYPPAEKRLRVRSQIDCDFDYVLREHA